MKNEDYPKIIKEAMKKSNYKKMVRGCKDYLKENSWEKISKKYIELYESLYWKDFKKYMPKYNSSLIK